jgi:hypothetical protein
MENPNRDDLLGKVVETELNARRLERIEKRNSKIGMGLIVAGFISQFGLPLYVGFFHPEHGSEIAMVGIAAGFALIIAGGSRLYRTVLEMNKISKTDFSSPPDTSNSPDDR